MFLQDSGMAGNENHRLWMGRSHLWVAVATLLPVVAGDEDGLAMDHCE